ncbi:helix-turn-helix transcriptional regulator [Microbacterium sp. ASV49]|uniref:Transcriptional regulator n=1 Tax=Microbacterium candidum TaxID=3041922 RepID=A0ABT7N1U0_9MICO|nr:hypothetical protein [Microbacterium sp. ASV49]MDL9980678.1 hypothetical protein [Microbacterium sp. ASV49]
MTTTREAIARLLAEAGGPMDAAAVAEATGIHVTTARFHLDQLVAGGSVMRAPDPEGAVGRPRVRYSPAAGVRGDPARAAMVTALADALDGAPDGAARARAAGRAWASGLPEATGLPAVLERLGFAPAHEDAGIRLRACPFADAARAHPGIVCEVHRGIIDRVLEGSTARAELVPFAGPEGCFVALSHVEEASGDKVASRRR